MFDIGFTELLLVGVVGLLVIGPERLPETIRTASGWLNRLRRGFNDIKREVQQELHNDEVMQELRRAGQEVKDRAKELGQSAGTATGNLKKSALDPPQAAPQPRQPDKPAEERPE